MDSESNESVYNKYGMSSRIGGMKCGVMAMAKCSTLMVWPHRENAR